LCQKWNTFPGTQATPALGDRADWWVRYREFIDAAADEE
jgi:hypothetical protein